MTHKLLLADDSVTIQKVVELTFSEEDFAIIAVGDGATALQKIRSERPDIILSDVIMPGMNGYDLCSAVKGDPALKGIPFLFLKGTFESFDEERATAVGSDGFIVKPFESQELVGRVKELVVRPKAAVPPPPPTPPVPEAEAFVHEEPAAFASDLTGPVGYGGPEAGEAEFAVAAGGTGAAEEGIEEDLWSEVKVSDHPIPQAQAPEPALDRGLSLEEQPVLEEVPPPGVPASEEIPGLHSAAATQAEPWPEAVPVSRPVPPPPPAPRIAPPPPPPAPRAAPVPPPAPAAPRVAAAVPVQPVPPAVDVERLVAERVEAVLRELAPGIIRDVTRQVVAEVAWEVVPEAAERLIRQEIDRLTGGARH